MTKDNYQRAMDHPIERTTPARPQAPDPREILPRIGLDLDALLSAEGVQRLCMTILCVFLTALVCLGVLAVLWHHDAPLRASWADVGSFITHLFRI